LGNRGRARRRASTAHRRLAAATTLGREMVIAPIDAELATMRRLHELI
jgi:hypothetical protein